jgi:hypothetical protein
MDLLGDPLNYPDANIIDKKGLLPKNIIFIAGEKGRQFGPSEYTLQAFIYDDEDVQ